MNDLVIKKATVKLEDVIKGDSAEDRMKLSRERRYTAIYNMKREEFDLKKPLGELKSFDKFSANGAPLNEMKIDIPKSMPRYSLSSDRGMKANALRIPPVTFIMVPARGMCASLAPLRTMLMNGALMSA